MNPDNGYAVIDLETTGFGGGDRIIEIGVAFLNPNLELEGTWETLVQPNRDVSNSHVHKLTPTELRDAPTWEEVAPVLARLLHGRVGVAHNASFEQRFLTKEFRRVNIDNNVADVPWVDTKVLSSLHLGRGKLSEALTVAGITNELPHAALPDALATAELLRELSRTWGARFRGTPLLFTAPLGSVEEPRLVTRESAQQKGEWITRIAGGLPSGGTNATAVYRETLRSALSDRRLTGEEILELGRTAAREGLTTEDIQEIHEDFLREIAIEAWMDGVITENEKSELFSLSEQLNVQPALVHELLTSPQTGSGEDWIDLKVGDRVALTGSMELPRETWEARVSSHGLLTGGVSKKTVLVVAANPDSRSGKARRAHELGIPIISEKHFATLLAGMEPPEVETDEAQEQIKVIETQPQAVRFNWVSTARPGITDLELPNNEIASLWISHYPAAQLREISPLLTRDLVIDLSGSIASKAGVYWARKFDPMLSATVEDLRDIPGVGAKKLERMVEAVILAAIDAESQNTAANDDYMEQFSDPYGEDQIVDESPVPPEEVDLLRGWLSLQGFPDLPEQVERAAPGAAKRFAETAPLAGLFAQCAQELAAACGDDERKLEIVSSRYMGNATLDEIGKTFGVTRERVRQLESMLKKDFDARSSLSALVAAELAEQFSPLADRASVLERMPELTDRAEPFTGTYEQYFQMWKLWTVEDGWITTPGFKEKTLTAFSACTNENNVARLDEVLNTLGVDEALFKQWSEHFPGVLFLKDGVHVLVANSHQDRAIGVLSLHGKPMSVDEIVEVLRFDGNVRSFSNQLYSDGRIIRTGRNYYGLTEWGLEEFPSINAWIANRIEASETGSVSLEELIADAPKFNVSENSVRAYAAGSDFNLTGGMVSMVSGEKEIIEDDPQDYRDLYWRDNAWELLLTVTGDHLRGSGFQVPRGAAGIYRVPVGGAVPVPSRLGDQYVRVNKLKQVSTSTIRRFLIELDSVEGDRVWLRYAPDQFDVRPAPAAVFSDDAETESSEGDLPRLLDYMGLDPDLAGQPAEALEIINAALGLDPGTARRRTVAVFRHRGQDHFAELIRNL